MGAAHFLGDHPRVSSQTLRRGELLAESPAELEQALNQLVDDGEFHHLDARLGRFNLFEAMGGVRAELRHSNFLGFLFSPNRAHGLGSIVLEKVLRAILDDVAPEARPIRSLQLAVADLDDAIVHRERDNIDLLIEIPSLDLVVMIENKVGAGTSDGQLRRYRDVVERRFPDRRRLLVFLTPDGARPDCEGYVAFSYRHLAHVIDDLARQDAIAAEPRLILAHYVEMLRRHVVPDDELKALALRLYDRHREAFDFVFASRPEPQGVLDFLKARVLSVEGLIEDRSTATIFRFLPSRWDEMLPTIGCSVESWTRTGRGLMFEIKLNPSTGRVHLILIMGPLLPELRERIYAAAMSRPGVFKGLVKPMGQQHSTLFSRELLPAALARTLDFEQQCQTAALAWSEFQRTELQVLIDQVEVIVGEVTTT
jgi:hypothetical protein